MHANYFSQITCLVLYFITVFAGNTRILNGQDAALGQFPFIISLRFLGYHFCAGSIVDENYILTAAHCVNGLPLSVLSVVAGTITLDSGGETYYIDDAYIDPKFNESGKAEFDFALLKLNRSVSFNDNVQKVSLSTKNVMGDTDVIAVGWGLTENKTQSNNLKFLLTKTISNKECLKILRTESYVRPTSLCTVSPQNKGVCNGDSGGPLITPDDDAQVGIVSYGFICGSGLPDVYTRVPKYVDKILSIIHQ